jgi:hypothetical protein
VNRITTLTLVNFHTFLPRRLNTLTRDRPPQCPVRVLAVGYLSASLGLAIGLFALIAYGLVLVAVLLLPETRGKQLLAYD